jgi:hypothetical protein
MTLLLMDKLIVAGTPKTPGIDFDYMTGDLTLTGKSIPENAAKIYEPALKWVQEYVLVAKPVTNFRLNLEYFNSSSTLWISKIVKTLCSINKRDYTLLIHIYFNIEDYDSIDDMRDEIMLLTNPILTSSQMSVGYKIYAVDDDGNVIKESMVFV